MNILVTGGAGFIGSNFALLAENYGATVTILDDFSTGNRENLRNFQGRLVEGSLLSVESVSEAVRGQDAVVHLAALGSVPRSLKDPLSSHAVNVTGTLMLLEQMRLHGSGRIIYSSSSSVYGLNPARPKSEREWTRPMSPYAVSKLAAEQYVLAYQQSFGFESAAFRFFNVFGPGQPAGHDYAAVIPTFISSMLNGQPVTVNGDGTQSRDFTYVGTVCDVLWRMVERQGALTEPVNLAFGTNTTLLSLISKLEESMGVKADVRFREERRGDVRHSQADNESLTRVFPGLTPVNLDEGLRRTIRWFEEFQ